MFEALEYERRFVDAERDEHYARKGLGAYRPSQFANDDYGGVEKVKSTLFA